VKDYVLDANALVRYLLKQNGASRVRELFIQTDKKQATLSVSVINLAEVLYVTARYRPLEDAERNIRKLSGLVEFVPSDTDCALAAAALRSRYKLGLADCFAAELAMRTGATLVTADPEFKRLGKQLKLLALPHHSV